jgi:hypothetical protein
MIGNEKDIGYTFTARFENASGNAFKKGNTADCNSQNQHGQILADSSSIRMINWIKMKLHQSFFDTHTSLRQRK